MQLEYPVFAFQKNDNMIYVFFIEDDLKSTNEDFLKKGGFKGNIIVDATGKTYKIKNAYKVKYLGLWGFNPLLKGRQILVDFEYEPETTQITLDNLKKDIIERIDKTKRIWQSAWDIDEFKKEIESSKTFRDTAHLLI